MTVPYLLRFCPYRASILWQSVTQGVASLALGYALVGLSARPRLNQKLLFVIVFNCVLGVVLSVSATKASAATTTGVSAAEATTA